MRHTTDNYIFLKLLQPDALGAPSLMPTFCFTPAQAATITRGPGQPPQGRPARVARGEGAAAAALPAARARSASSSTRYRCLSCHRIGGSGGDLSTVPLDRIGSQLQHDYLVGYLLNPGAVRVSVEARMPVFHMLPGGGADDRRLRGHDLPGRRARPLRHALHAGRGAAAESSSTAQLGCVGCHQLNLQGGYVGPDLSNTGTRLRPGWIAAWLVAPEPLQAGDAAARLRPLRRATRAP